MGYTKKTWVNKPNTTTPILADDLNHIEQGIYDNDQAFLTNGLNVSNEVDEDYRVNLLNSKNLFDKDTAINNYGFPNLTNGTITYSASNWKYVYIPCKPNTKYTLSGISSESTGTGITMYNVNTFLSSATTYKNGTFTTARTATKLCVGCRDTELNTLQLEEGDTATTYKEFIPNQIVVDDEKYSDTLNVGSVADSRSRVNVLHSKNLLIPNLISQTLYGLTITKNSDKSYTINGTSTQAFSIEWATDIFLKKGHYYITFNNKFPINIFFTKQDNTNLVIASSMASDDYFEFDLTEDTTFKSLKSYISRAGIPFDNEIFSPMISTSMPTSYEPYITPSIYVDNEEIYSKDNIDKLLAFNERVDNRFYTKFLNTSSSSAFGITIKGSIDRQTYLVMGVNNAMGSVLSIITSSSNTTNVKNLGTVNLSVSRSGSNISVSGMGQYTYVSVIGYDDFILYR